MSIDGKYPNTSVTWKKNDRWMVDIVIDISRKAKWSIAQTIAVLIGEALKARGYGNEKKA